MERLVFPLSKKEAEKSGVKYSSSQNRDALFPTTLRELRKERGISQADLAQELGVTKSTIGLYEAGDNVPDVKTLSKMASFYECSADYLLGLSDYRKNENQELTVADIGLSEKAVLKIKKLRCADSGSDLLLNIGSYPMEQIVNGIIENRAFKRLVRSLSLYCKLASYVPPDEIDENITMFDVAKANLINAATGDVPVPANEAAVIYMENACSALRDIAKEISESPAKEGDGNGQHN